MTTATDSSSGSGSEPRAGADAATGSRGGYTVLARRYRSRDFDELIGQEAIARTLQNAIRAGRTAHAYLFCGTRGVGKTSMARIFAKAINVTCAAEPPTQADAVAEAILRGDDLDVIEIDGASNRGINEARDLIAGAGLSPSRCRYKIYIIDEVHMLTREAFNALLKTMEEPPEHVKFILCTTDPQKVPATIQSRCQRFDFRAIPTALIAGQLQSVLAQEGIEADEDVVRMVAGLGQGSMRDALSLLDRMIAGGEASLTMERAEMLLGLPDHAVARRVLEAVAAEDPAAGLEAAAELIAGGATVEQALEMITEQLRVLLLLATCGADTDLVDLSDEGRAEAVALAAHFDAASLVHLIALADANARNARGSATARAIFDAAVVRMCLGRRLADVSAVLAGGEKKNDARPGSSPRAVTPAARREAPAPAPARAPASVSAPEPAPAGSPAPGPTPAPAAPVAAPATAAAADPVIADDALWPAVLAAADSPRDRSKLAGFTFSSFDGSVVRLEADRARGGAAFLAAQAEPIAEFITRVTSRRVRVEIAVAPETETAPRPVASEQQVAAARDLPAVRHAIEIFDAVVTDVRAWTPEAAEASDER